MAVVVWLLAGIIDIDAVEGIRAFEPRLLATSTVPVVGHGDALAGGGVPRSKQERQAGVFSRLVPCRTGRREAAQDLGT